jgi:CBS domain-containing protein
MHQNRPMREVIVRREPVSLPPDASVAEACRAMRLHRIGAVLVTDEAGRLVGIFTGRDAVCRMLAEGRDAHATPLRAVMTARPVTLGPGVRASEALRLMHDSGFRHIPVVEGERLLGIVSRGDFHAAEVGRLEAETELWEIR